MSSAPRDEEAGVPGEAVLGFPGDRDWFDALDALIEEEGPEAAGALLERLHYRAYRFGIPISDDDIAYARFIVLAVLNTLAQRGELAPGDVKKAMKEMKISGTKRNPMTT